MRWLLALLMLMARMLPAAADPVAWTVAVDAHIAGAALHYNAKAWVYSPGKQYSATIYAIGPYRSSQSTLPIVASFHDVLAREPQAAVFNGGYSDDGFYVPSGLLLVQGRVAHPMSFEKPNGQDYGLSAIVCIDPAGRLLPLHTAAFDNRTSSIKTQCSSAFQAGPFIVENGQSAIRQTEIAKKRPPAFRTILGFDAQGVPYLIVFTQKVHLLVAAEFLLGRPGKPGTASIRNAKTPSGLASNTGLGLRTAINLNGDTSSVFYFRGRHFIGDASAAMPSAVALSTP